MTDEQNLIKEVNEEVRQDNYKRIFKKYKKHIFILIIFLLIFVTSINFFKYIKEKNVEKQSELFFQSIEYIEEEDYQNAKKILEEINKVGNSGYNDLLKLYILGLANKKEISLNLNKIEAKKNKIFSNLIVLQSFSNQINLDFDNIDNISEIVNLSKPSSDWKYLAHELLASYYLKKNDIDNALQSLNVIINSQDSGEFIQERAKTLVEMIKKNK